MQPLTGRFSVFDRGPGGNGGGDAGEEEHQQQQEVNREQQEQLVKQVTVAIGVLDKELPGIVGPVTAQALGQLGVRSLEGLFMRSKQQLQQVTTTQAKSYVVVLGGAHTLVEMTEDGCMMLSFTCLPPSVTDSTRAGYEA